jgi:hypothetical protein
VRSARVPAAEVIPLSAAAEVEDRFAAVHVADRRQASGHLADGGVPVDLLEGAVGAAAQRHGQPIRAVLVVIEPQRLVAGIARGDRMGPVAADAREAPAVELHLDAAVALAQDARGALPVAVSSRFGHRILPGAVLARPSVR